MLHRPETRGAGRTPHPAPPEWFTVLLITVTLSAVAAMIALRLW
jgi:hypothetical protein